MHVKIILVFLQLALVRALLDGSLTAPSTSELLNMINQLKQTVTGLQQTDINAQQTISSLQQTVSGLQQTVSSLQQTDTNLQQIISSLQQNVSNSQQTISSLQQTVSSLQNTVNNSKQTISSLQQTVNNLNQNINADTAVAFSATLTQSKDHLGMGQVILFDRVLTNVGSGYEPRMGHFTAPKMGTYVFTVSAMGHPGQLLELQMVKNGVSLEIVYSDSTSSSPFAVATETIILHLNANDMVWVAYGGGSGYIHGAQQNSFSGFLVK